MLVFVWAHFVNDIVKLAISLLYFAAFSEDKSIEKGEYSR